LNGHIPTAEIDDAGAQFLMQLKERCSSSHGSSKTKGGTAGARAAHLSCDL